MRIAGKNDNQCITTLKGSGRQCPNMCIEGSEHCAVHGGLVDAESARKKQYEQTKLEFWLQQIKKETESDTSRSLKEEIGILKILLKSHLGMCNGHNDLIIYSAQIQSVILSIEKVLSSFVKIEKTMGELLNREELAVFADTVIRIIAKEVKDPEIIDNISKQILEVIKEC